MIQAKTSVPSLIQSFQAPSWCFSCQLPFEQAWMRGGRSTCLWQLQFTVTYLHRGLIKKPHHSYCSSLIVVHLSCQSFPSQLIVPISSAWLNVLDQDDRSPLPFPLICFRALRSFSYSNHWLLLKPNSHRASSSSLPKPYFHFFQCWWCSWRSCFHSYWYCCPLAWSSYYPARTWGIAFLSSWFDRHSRMCSFWNLSWCKVASLACC